MRYDVREPISQHWQFGMINKSEHGVHLIGKVGATPHIASMSGVATVSFPIVTEAIKFWTDDDGRRHTKSRTVWIRVVAYEPRVVSMIKTAREGDMISIDGMVERRSYVSDGVESEIVEIVAEDVLHIRTRREESR